MSITRTERRRGICQTRVYTFSEDMGALEFDAFVDDILSAKIGEVVSDATLIGEDELRTIDWMPIVRDENREGVRFHGFEVTVSLESAGETIGEYRMDELDRWLDRFDSLIEDQS